METPRWLDTAQWPWAPRWAQVEGGRLHHLDEGAGPAVVLVHGTPTWSFDWRHVVRALVPGHRVVAVDHLGFGLSERPEGAAYTPEAHAARFAQFMAAVVPQGKVTLVVHDFGGPIALQWALAHPERLARLVVVNSWAWSFAEDPKMARRAKLVQGALGRFLYRRFNASLKLIMPSAYARRARLTPALHAQYLAVFPEPDGREKVLYALAQALLGSSAYYASLWERRAALAQVPVHLLWGVKDTAFQLPILERWREGFPHATVERFDDAGHWPHEEQPEAFVAALRALLLPAAAPQRQAAGQGAMT
jgi:haloalkane dehalogenase